MIERSMCLCSLPNTCNLMSLSLVKDYLLILPRLITLPVPIKAVVIGSPIIFGYGISLRSSLVVPDNAVVSPLVRTVVPIMWIVLPVGWIVFPML